MYNANIIDFIMLATLENHIDKISCWINFHQIHKRFIVRYLQDKSTRVLDRVINQDSDDFLTVDEVEHCIFLLFFKLLGQIFGSEVDVDYRH